MFSTLIFERVSKPNHHWLYNRAALKTKGTLPKPESSFDRKRDCKFEAAAHFGLELQQVQGFR